MTSSTEIPFKIAVPEAQISLLQQKLAVATLPDELPDSGWDYGVPLGDIERLVHHWKEKYDWQKHEAELNAELPQFTLDIEVDGGFGTINVHYVHKKSDVKNAIPLLFVHGCKLPDRCTIDDLLTIYTGPGSFAEVRKILPLLIKASPDHPSFHVVAPSLPGYVFSSAPTKKGFSIPQYAEVGPA